MDLRHLRAFVTVAEEGTFTKAASRLHISQPPLTKRVQQLERELGTRLFVRHRDGVELTPDGRMLLERARAALTAFREFEDSIKAVSTPAQPLRVGIGWGLWEAVERIRSHHAKRFPDARMAAEDLCTDRSGTHERRIDVAIVRRPVDETMYESAQLFQEQFVALLANTHPLASRKSVRLADLVTVPLLMYDRCVGPGVYDKDAGAVRGRRHQSSHPRRTAAAVRPGGDDARRVGRGLLRRNCESLHTDPPRERRGGRSDRRAGRIP